MDGGLWAGPGRLLRTLWGAAVWLCVACAIAWLVLISAVVLTLGIALR